MPIPAPCESTGRQQEAAPGPEVRENLDAVGAQERPGSLLGGLTPFRGNPESWYDRNAAETLDGPLSRALGPSTRDFELKWREWFLSWSEKKEGEEIDRAPRVTAGSVVPDGNLEKFAGYIRLSCRSLSVFPGARNPP